MYISKGNMSCNDFKICYKRERIKDNFDAQSLQLDEKDIEKLNGHNFNTEL